MSIFWHSHLSQIYPELNKLEKDEFITSRIVVQEGKPDKKLYAIAQKGKTELMMWLLEASEPTKVKDPFLMQTFFMDNIPVDEVLLKLNIYKKERKQRLEKIKAIVQDRFKGIKERNVMKARILMSSAVLKRGMDQELQYIKWCDDTIKLIESCKELWERNNENNTPTFVRFEDIEDIFLKYFGDFA